MKPSKQFQDRGSWSAKVELLLKIARYQLPEVYIEKTKAEIADENFERDLDINGWWWKQPNSWTVERIVEVYDEAFSESRKYTEAMIEYFSLRPDRKIQYHEAGGTLV
jgi:hypothetical protein